MNWPQRITKKGEGEPNPIIIIKLLYFSDNEQLEK